MRSAGRPAWPRPSRVEVRTAGRAAGRVLAFFDPADAADYSQPWIRPAPPGSSRADADAASRALHAFVALTGTSNRPLRPDSLRDFVLRYGVLGIGEDGYPLDLSFARSASGAIFIEEPVSGFVRFSRLCRVLHATALRARHGAVVSKADWRVLTEHLGWAHRSDLKHHRSVPWFSPMSKAIQPLNPSVPHMRAVVGEVVTWLVGVRSVGPALVSCGDDGILHRATNGGLWGAIVEQLIKRLADSTEPTCAFCGRNLSRARQHHPVHSASNPKTRSPKRGQDVCCGRAACIKERNRRYQARKRSEAKAPAATKVRGLLLG
jgi:hypothetical protein